MKKIQFLAIAALVLAYTQSHAFNLTNVTVNPGQVVVSNGSYDVYGNYINNGTINNYGPVTMISGSTYSGGTGSMLNNYSTINLNAGSNVNYEIGSGFVNYSGAIVTNDATVINKGSLVYGAGSIVNGAGSYTQMSGGSLVVNGTFTQSGGIYITDNGYLGGSGTINGNVYASGADVIVAPGNSPGHLTINGDLKLENGAKLVIQVYSLTEFDKISITGNFDFGAARILFDVKPDLRDTFLEKFNFSNFFEKIEVSGEGHAPELSLFDEVTFEYGDANSAPGTSDNLIRINDLVSAVPEPETYAMMLTGLSLLGAMVRRRKAQ